MAYKKGKSILYARQNDCVSYKYVGFTPISIGLDTCERRVSYIQHNILAFNPKKKEKEKNKQTNKHT